MPSLILASASPQRRQLLTALGVQFTVLQSGVDESACTVEEPAARAQTLARAKAQSIAALNAGSIVIGCDTLVVAQDGTLLEKPKDEDEAREMILRHSGGVSTVISALCLLLPNGQFKEGLDLSSVHFKSLTRQELEWWVKTDLWRGRSGAFQIDGLGQLMIQRIEGDWTGIVGLPVYLLGRLLTEACQPLIHFV